MKLDLLKQHVGALPMARLAVGTFELHRLGKFHQNVESEVRGEVVVLFLTLMHAN